MMNFSRGVIISLILVQTVNVTKMILIENINHEKQQKENSSEISNLTESPPEPNTLNGVADVYRSGGIIEFISAKAKMSINFY